MAVRERHPSTRFIQVERSRYHSLKSDSCTLIIGRDLLDVLKWTADMGIESGDDFPMITLQITPDIIEWMIESEMIQITTHPTIDRWKNDGR